MFINVEETPNPNTLKFIPEKDISVDRSYIFKKTDDLKNNDFLKVLRNIWKVLNEKITFTFVSRWYSSFLCWRHKSFNFIKCPT